MGVTQTSGGPLAINSPYNNSGNNVGAVNTSVNGIFSSFAPVYGGRASFVLLAKSSNNTPSSGDYGEVLTVIASANF